MSDLLDKLNREMLIRSAKGTSVIVPMIILYVVALIEMDFSQLRWLLGTAAVAGAPIFALYTYQTRLHMRPMAVVLNGVKNDEESLLAAEKRALNMPYIIAMLALLYFTLVGALVGLIVYAAGVITLAQAFYVAGSASTGGAAAGITGYYYAKEPLRDILAYIWERKGVQSRPPFFVPLFMKLVGLFTLATLLTVIFLGFLTYVTIQDIVKNERIQVQREDLAQKAGSVYEQEERALPKVYCTVDDDFVVTSCSGDEAPSDEVLSSLNENPASTVRDGQRIWIATPLSSGFAISGWQGRSGSIMLTGIRGYFIKVALVVLFVGFALGMIAARDISDPLRDMSTLAVKIAREGAEDRDISTGSEDETGILARSFHHMTESLLEQLQNNRLLLEGIENAVESLSGMSEQLVNYVNQQASANNQQATTSEQAAVTCEEISQTSRQIAENAASVARSAEIALQTTREGSGGIELTKTSFIDIQQKMKAITESAGSLSERSRMIGGIVGMIDEISSQINLLSLNAAIEAAGNSGQSRRFATVANEVRSLARRTDDSTKRIREIVEIMDSSVNQMMDNSGEGEHAVERGMETIEMMERMFEEILSSSEESASQVEHIDRMSDQQYKASQEMAGAVSGVRDTATELSGEVKALQQMVVDLNSTVLGLRSSLADYYNLDSFNGRDES